MNYDEKLIQELSEIIVGVVFVSISLCSVNIVFFLIGVYYILKANKSYKSRQSKS